MRNFGVSSTEYVSEEKASFERRYPAPKSVLLLLFTQSLLYNRLPYNRLPDSTRYSSLVNVSRVSCPACVSVITRLRDTRPFSLNCFYIEEDADVLLKRRTDALRVSD